MFPEFVTKRPMQQSHFLHTTNGDNAEVRRNLYAGVLYLVPGTNESAALAAAILLRVEAEFADVGPPREAQFQLSAEDFFARAGRLRKRFYTDADFHEQVAAVIQSLQFNAAEHAFDPIRLRVVTHDGHENPAAKAIYYGHRDTWYSNPQSMITWWIPLHDVAADETFEFFPEEFSRIVDNDSEIFDFDEWVEDGQEKRIGWQNGRTGLTAQYPELQEAPRGSRIPVACNAGDILLFSGQHLHQTRKNCTGRTRFSIDFRTVHLGDHAESIEAVNVDNRSRGSSLRQFIQGADFIDDNSRE